MSYVESTHRQTTFWHRKSPRQVFQSTRQKQSVADFTASDDLTMLNDFTMSDEFVKSYQEVMKAALVLVNF